MKNITFFALLFLLVFGCTPKTTETTTGSTMPDKTNMPDKDKMKDDMKDKVVNAAEAWRSTPPKGGPAPKISIGKSDQFTLDNGLKVIVVENNKLPRVSYQLFVDAPEIMQGDAVGYIDFAGQLLNKGTRSKSKAEIDEAVDFMGASMNTSASGVFASSLSRHSDKLMAIMADVVKNPSFPQAEFDKLKKQTLSGLAQNRESPEAIASNVSTVLRYGKKHPYGEITTEQTVEKIDLAKTKSYYQKYFKPDYSYLVVVGDTDVAKTKALVKQHLGDWKKAGKKEQYDYPMPETPDATTVDFVNKTGAVQSVINITYPVKLKPGSSDLIKASVANTMLGGFFQSRLNDKLREQKAFTYGARSRLSYDKNVGYFLASSSVRNEVTDSSLVEFMYELNNIRDVKPSKEEVELAKAVMAGNFGRSLERPETVARFALNTARYNLPKDYYATYLEKLSKVTAEDVQEMSQKYFLPENAHVIVVGNQDEVAEKLGQFSTDGKIRYYDVYGNEMDLSKNTTPDGLTAETVVMDYVKAIGGKDKLMAVKDVYSKASAEMQGMTLSMENYQMGNTKYATSVTMMGNVVQSLKYDGTKAKVGGMQGEQLLEGAEADAMKGSALIFPELHYDKMDYKIKLNGTEKVNGKDAYKVSVEDPTGKKSTDYYDTMSKLKVRSVSPEGDVTFMDYKAVDGVMFPFKIKVVNPQMPMPLEMMVSEVKVNKGIEEATFKVD